MTLASRVADEAGVTLGDDVGYAVRFDERGTSSTSLRFVTDGVLLREASSDRMLRRYDCVLLDEAHERSVQTDLLAGLLRALQKRRREARRMLRVVVMSATMDVERVSKYFGGARVLYVQGRQHPVRLMHTLTPVSDAIDAALRATLQVLLGREQAGDSGFDGGDVLVFLAVQD